MGEHPGGRRILRRAAWLAGFALFSAVASLYAIVPSSGVELLLAKTAVLEPLPIRVEEALLPAPTT